MEGYFNTFFFGPLSAGKGYFTKKWSGLNIFFRLLSLVVNRFFYDLPDTMDWLTFEMSLIYSNAVLVVKHDGELINLIPNGEWGLNRYSLPSSIGAIDCMGMSYGNFIPDLPGNPMPDCVMVYNDRANVAPISRIMWYANRLTDLQGSIESCIYNMRGSIVISCTSEQAKAVRRAFENAADGLPVIMNFGSEEGAMQLRPEVMFNPLTGEALTTLLETYDKTLAQFLQEFGITANGVVNKLSGVSDEELAQMDAATEIVRNRDLKVRQKAMAKIKKLFGVECSVELNKPKYTEAGGYGVRLVKEGGEDDAEKV